MEYLGDEEAVHERMRSLAEKFREGERTEIDRGELTRWIQQVANARSKTSLHAAADKISQELVEVQAIDQKGELAQLTEE